MSFTKWRIASVTSHVVAESTTVKLSFEAGLKSAEADRQIRNDRLGQIRLFQTIGTAWQNARLVNSSSSCCRLANSCRVDAVDSMVCKDESVHGGSMVVVSSWTGTRSEQVYTPLGGKLVANWQPMKVGEDWSNVITPMAHSYDTSNQLCSFRTFVADVPYRTELQ